MNKFLKFSRLWNENINNAFMKSDKNDIIKNDFRFKEQEVVALNMNMMKK